MREDDLLEMPLVGKTRREHILRELLGEVEARCRAEERVGKWLVQHGDALRAEREGPAGEEDAGEEGAGEQCLANIRDAERRWAERIEGAADTLEQMGEAALAKQLRGYSPRVCGVLAIEELRRWLENALNPPQPEPVDEWLPADLPSTCAKALGISLTTLKRYERDGRVRIDKVAPKRWRINKADAAKLQRDD